MSGYQKQSKPIVFLFSPSSCFVAKEDYKPQYSTRKLQQRQKSRLLLVFMMTEEYQVHLINYIVMKQQRRLPGTFDLMSRQTEYQTHLHRLQQIQTIRKQSLNRKSTYEKTVMIEHIKNQKHFDFISKLQRESNKISQQNCKIVRKLQKTFYSISDRPNKSALSRTSLSSAMKKNREKEIIKQNSRIFSKLNRSCPSVNMNKITGEYEKIKEIGERLRKYDPNCQLKAQKMLKTMTLSASRTLQIPTSAEKQRITRNSWRAKQKIASFYNKQDILKNKIQTIRVGKSKQKLPMGRQKGKSEEGIFQTQINPQL